MTEVVLNRKRQLYHLSLWAFGIVLSAVLVVILTIVFLNSEENHKGVQRLLDCTTPGGVCYQQGRDSQSGAVGTINRITVVAVYCAKLPGNTTLAQIQACVELNLK